MRLRKQEQDFRNLRLSNACLLLSSLFGINFLLYFFFRLLVLLHSALPSSLVIFLILFFFLIKTISSLFSQFSSSNLLIQYRSICLFSLVFCVALSCNWTSFFRSCALFFLAPCSNQSSLGTLFDSSFSLVFVFFICVFHLIIFKLSVLILKCATSPSDWRQMSSRIS